MTIERKNHPLTLADIMVNSYSNPTALAITLQTSKSNPFSMDHTIWISRVQSPVCPVIAMLAYLSMWAQG